MSRYDDFRSSTGNLAYGGGGGERWDSERFSREREHIGRAGRAIVTERDRFDDRDRDRFERSRGGFGGRPRDRSADGMYGGGRGGRFEEKDRFMMEERLAPPVRNRPAPRYFDEDDVDVSPQRGAMVPFDRSRRQSINAERGYGPPARRGPARPTFIRRQSSLDTFDRKPMPKYGDRERAEIMPRYGDRERTEVIPIPIPPRRRRSPPAPHYADREYYEEIRVVEPDPDPYDDVREVRERTAIHRHGPAGSEYEFREKEIYEEEEPAEKPFPRRGKTRMPKRLVNKRAVIELGYPFEEEGETIVILKALGKEHIDEVVKISRQFNEVTENRTTYMIEAPAPPPPEPQVVERRTEVITVPAPPPPPPMSVAPPIFVPAPMPAPMPVSMEIPQSVRDWDGRSSRHERHESHGRSQSVKSGKSGKSRKSRRNSSPSSSEDDDRHDSRSVDGRPLVILPERRNPERIKAEIRALEAEKKALKYEREMDKEHKKAEMYREGDIYIEKERNVVKIEKDRKAPNPKLIKAMLATLT